MRMKIWMKNFALVPALCLAGFSTVARAQGTSQQTGDPVADAARKAREAKKDVPKPKKVWTDEDLKKTAPDAVSTVGPPATGTGTATASTQQAAGGNQGNDPNGEVAWRAKFKDQRDKMARAEKELDILQRELEKAQLQYYPDPQKAMT